MSNQTIESAKSHPKFILVINQLITNRFFSENNLEVQGGIIREDDLEFATWLATIIASSDIEDDKQLASIFAILVFLENRENIGLIKASYIILSRSGNLVLSRFFDEIFDYQTENTVEGREVIGFKTHFNTVIDYELGLKLSSNEIKAGELKFIGSDYQKSLWNSLVKTDSNIAISAPTSAGKSFVIQNYLKKRFEESDTMFGIYIVPTRALIAQVTERLKSVFPADVTINTAFVENENPEIPQFDSKHLFIVTPERCLKLIQYSYREYFEPNILFIDEIQNIENQDGRGFVLEYLLNEIKIQWPRTRIMIAGPFLDRPDELFTKLFRDVSEKKQTLFSPVFQLKIGLKPSIENDSAIQVSLHFRGETINTFSIELGFNIRRFFAMSKGRALIELTKFFGRGSKNIIYVPRTDYAESHAVHLAKILGEQELSEDISDLIDLVEEEIHPQYYLIDSLRSKCAFHHGRLPEIIRAEIEYLFSTGKLDNLVCTATLMEGVNLPAQKVFVAIPKKENMELSSFEFGNIIGRAGRVRDSPIGSIYCLQSIDENWAEEKYNSSPEKQIEPAIYKILSVPQNELLTAISANLDNQSRELEYAVCFLKHKFLKGDQALHDYLAEKNVTEDYIDSITQALNGRLNNILIPSELSKLNPSIDPELQNILYTRIINEGISKWVIHDNGHLGRRMKKDLMESTSHEENNLFGQLKNILFELDSIFNFNSEAYFKHQISRTVPQMVFYAVKWMQGDSMKTLISEQIYFRGRVQGKINVENRKDVNRLINEVMKVYNTIVSFILVKYLKLLVDILNTVLTEEQKEYHRLTLSLPVMLELGTYNPIVLQLISTGISRSIAIKLHKLIPEEYQTSPLEWLKEQETLPLKPVYIRYLKRKKILSH